MKTLILHNRRPVPEGFTLVELMVSMAIFSLLIIGLIATQIYGMNMYSIVKVKLGASDESRHALASMVEVIRSAKEVHVGMSEGKNHFEGIELNSPQIGNAVMIIDNADTNKWSKYFVSGAMKLVRKDSEMSDDDQVVCDHELADMNVFTAEDFLGNTLTNNTVIKVVGINLNFSQIEYPIIKIGPGQFYDYYRLRTKITLRRGGI